MTIDKLPTSYKKLDCCATCAYGVCTDPNWDRPEFDALSCCHGVKVPHVTCSKEQREQFMVEMEDRDVVEYGHCHYFVKDE